MHFGHVVANSSAADRDNVRNRSQTARKQLLIENQIGKWSYVHHIRIWCHREMVGYRYYRYRWQICKIGGWSL